MMKAYIEQLMDYNYWANGLILKYIEKLSEDQFIEERTAFGDSLKGILTHVLFGEQLWLDRMQGRKMTREAMIKFFRPNKYPTLKPMISDWFDLELSMRSYMSDLNDSQLLSTFKYSRTDSVEYESRRVDIFTQMVLHGMQHRSECAVILTNLGHSPGNIDYIVYLRG
ncbi:MAG: DinB family protein [Anaerolineales bacterium]